MIKIIKYGKVRKVDCPHCESVLEYEESDIIAEQIGLNEYEYYIQCPVCRETIAVNKIVI